MTKTLTLALASTLALTSVVSVAPVASAADMDFSRGSQRTERVAAVQPRERLGTLSCEVAGGIGLVIGSSKTVDCQFRQRTGEVERYTGTIGKLGLDVGITGKTYLSWIVVNTSATAIGEGSLAGTYVGASVGASLGFGLGANALIGGNAKNFGLQPLSAQAGTGINIAAGVSRLQLNPAS